MLHSIAGYLCTMHTDGAGPNRARTADGAPRKAKTVYHAHNVNYLSALSLAARVCLSVMGFGPVWRAIPWVMVWGRKACVNVNGAISLPRQIRSISSQPKQAKALVLPRATSSMNEILAFAQGKAPSDSVGEATERRRTTGYGHRILCIQTCYTSNFKTWKVPKLSRLNAGGLTPSVCTNAPMLTTYSPHSSSPLLCWQREAS